MDKSDQWYKIRKAEEATILTGPNLLFSCTGPGRPRFEGCRMKQLDQV